MVLCALIFPLLVTSYLLDDSAASPAFVLWSKLHRAKITCQTMSTLCPKPTTLFHSLSHLLPYTLSYVDDVKWSQALVSIHLTVTKITAEKKLAARGFILTSTSM